MFTLRAVLYYCHKPLIQRWIFLFRNLEGFHRECLLIMMTSLLLCISYHSTAQINQVKKETAIGRAGEEEGFHSVITTTNGDIITLTSSRGYSHTGPADTLGILVTKLNANQQIIWEKLFNDPIADLKSEGIIETSDKGYLVVGTSITNWSTDYKIYLLKLNINGEIEWEKRLGGTGDADGVDVEETIEGNFVVLANVDKSSGEIVNQTGKKQMWMGKISAAGNLLTGKLLTNNHVHFGFDLAKSNDGNYVACGRVNDSVPVGVDRSYGDGVLIKFDDEGAVLWQNYPGGNAENEYLYQVDVDQNGNVFAAGYTVSNTGDFQSNKGGSDGWIVKLSAGGNLLWNRLVGGSKGDVLYAISVSREGHIFAGGGTFSNDGDLASNYYSNTIWLTKIDEQNDQIENGYFGYVKTFNRYITDIEITDLGKIYFVARADGGNSLMSNPKGLIDLWLVEAGASNTLKGSVFIDINGNGQKDPGEKQYTGGKMVFRNEATNEIEYKIANNGSFLAYMDTGSYDVSYISDEPYYTIAPQNKKFTYTGYNISDSVVFALVPIPGKNDLSINIVPMDFARPGFNASYQLRYANKGNTVISNAIVKFVKNAAFNLTSASPAGYTITGDTLTWNIPTLQQMDEGQIILNGQFSTPPQIRLGDTLLSTAFIYPLVNDENPDGNTASLKEIVRGSFDPNDKTEFHAGIFPSALVGTENLVYLVRFQNTGTDTAFRIIIRDTLHAHVDPLTLKIISASHNYTLNIKNGSELQWDFDNIRLPDSNVNEKASHGYILYSVKPKPTLVTGDVITNRASIYFDYNLPVETNTTSTRITDIAVALPKPVITGLKNSYCGNDKVQTIRISNIPAVIHATISVKLNGSAVSVDNNGNFSIDPTKLQSGSQQIEVSFNSYGKVSTHSVDFTVTAPVKPIVKLSANFGEVNNGTTALQFTATVIAGRGDSPLYTFSTDRGLSVILQSESNSNTLNVTSQILTVGENWIFVRMKSSESCVTSGIAIDSIKITRNAVTAIVDIDFPTSIIIAYPNPFRSDITINGLQASGTYMVQVISAGGTIVKTQDVQRKTSVTFYNLDANHGIYFIRVFDKKKNRWVGSMPVIGL